MLLAREVTSVELVRAHLDRIEELDRDLNAFVTVTAEQALDLARKADERLSKGGDIPPLLGLPVALKDILCTKDVLSTAGSRILSNFVPAYTAHCVENLCEKSGAVSLGKLNMDEFAMGSSGENSHFGPTKNPHDQKRVPGGSSSGSAAAVAASMVPAALGSDTGGSIRQPAAFCGVVGIKPTYGRVSRWGVIAFASSLDQIGPVAKTVEDAALMLNAICGHDPRDSTSSPEKVPDFTDGLDQGIKGLRVGVPAEYFTGGLDPRVEKAVRNAAEKARELGARIVDVSLPNTKYAIACYYIIAMAECSSNLARYDGVRYGLRQETSDLVEMYTRSRSTGFGAEVRRRILLGVFALSAGYYEAYYGRACQVRTLIRRDFEKAFEKADIILGPTAPETAFMLGERTDDPLKMYLSDILTVTVNLAGLPGMSMPCGVDDKGLPIGLQLIGRPMGEATLLRAGAALEGALPKRPVPSNVRAAKAAIDEVGT